MYCCLYSWKHQINVIENEKDKKWTCKIYKYGWVSEKDYFTLWTSCILLQVFITKTYIYREVLIYFFLLDIHIQVKSKIQRKYMYQLILFLHLIMRG